MPITPVGLNPAVSASAGPATQIAAHSESGNVSVTFAPGSDNASPLDRVGSGVMTKLKQFEARRAESSQAMSSVGPGPANPVDMAKEKLLAGPASKSLAASSGMPAAGTDHVVGDAVKAMTRSFDYAIETQLIVKTGSQMSTSASSLMRGQ